MADFGSSDETVRAWENGLRAAPAHVLRTLQSLCDGLRPDRSGTRSAVPASRPSSPTQTAFEWAASELQIADRKSERTGSFVDNMQLPVHRWFRYSAGFSAEWVRSILGTRALPRQAELLFDPFAGSGTSLLAAESEGVASAGAERHPLVYRVAKAKLGWRVDIGELRERSAELVQRAQRNTQPEAPVSPLLAKCYTDDALNRLNSLRLAYLERCTGDEISEILWLAITSILRECSAVGTAQWQYVLPNKTKARVSDPFSAFSRRIELIAADIASAKASWAACSRPEIVEDDARSLGGFKHLAGKATLVITSPPYPNNYDYADATRLEMTFWGEVSSWGDLQKSVRQRLVRSCSQHSAAERLRLEELLDNPAVAPIRDELSSVCQELALVRESKGGRKTYHTMVAAYFADLALVWKALRELCASDADICFVIGDSAPYGVYVPVDRWLGRLAVASGFHNPRFDKIRDRNLKWKNRKHRVPLKEGNLWLRG